MKHSLLGHQLDYKYYILKDYENLYNEHIDPRFLNSAFEKLQVLGLYSSEIDKNISSNDIREFLSIKVPSTFTSFNEDDFYDFIEEYYSNFNYSSKNFIGENKNTEFNRIILPPLITYDINNKINFIGVSIKFYRRSEFIIEIFQNIDDLELSNDYTSFYKNFKKIFIPNYKYGKPAYYKESSKKNSVDVLDQYIKQIEPVLYETLNAPFFIKNFRVFSFDNKMFSKKIDDEILKKITTSPHFVDLGNTFHQDLSNITHYHFDIYSDEVNLCFSINSSKYQISREDYIENRLKYTAINYTYILSALVPIHNNIITNCIKIERPDKWGYKTLEEINKFNQYLNNFNYNHTNIYTSKQPSIKILYSKLKSEILNSQIQSEVENIFNTAKDITEIEKNNTQKSFLNLIGFVTFVITCFSIIQILDIFKMSFIPMLITSSSLVLVILLSWRIYRYSSYKKRFDNLTKFGQEKPSRLSKISAFLMY
ncbi:hypothetical protein [Staphylococcus shinii]|uniref:hypothetical protein n=1 Tax=Staphylococcus shinii TaxID=2912228 RepID=UPI003CF2E3BF